MSTSNDSLSSGAPSTRALTFKGDPLTLVGREIRVGDRLPEFHVVGNDMQDVNSNSFKGKVLILCSVPSLDTPVCSIETKRFNDEVGRIGAACAALTVSLDLPFAQKRWCLAESADTVVTASDYKNRTFGETFGVQIQEWGLLSRAVFVVDKSGTVVHVEYVPEVAAEPNYEAALQAAKNAL